MVEKFIKRKNKVILNITFDLILFFIVRLSYLENIRLFSFFSSFLFLVSFLISYFLGRYHFINKQTLTNISKYIALSIVSLS